MIESKKDDRRKPALPAQSDVRGDRERQMQDEARRRIDGIAPTIESGLTGETARGLLDGGCGGE